MGVLSVGSVLLAMSATTPAATAADAPTAPLVLRPKSAIAATAPAPRGTPAPFLVPTDAIELDIPKPADPRLSASPSSCSGERSLCYDPGSGRIVYKPARAFMPDLPGLTAESLSVKRDRIVFRYSF